MKKILLLLLLITVFQAQAHFYVGLGATKISGNSGDNKINSITPATIYMGREFSNNFELGLSSSLNKPSDNESSYKLKYTNSFYLLFNYSLSTDFKLLAKAGLTTLRLNSDIRELKNTNNFGFGGGLRYHISNKIFVDVIAEKLINKTIDGHDEDFNKTSIIIKHFF